MSGARDVVQRRRDGAGEDAPSIRQRHAAPGLLEEIDAERRFQPPELMADRAIGQIELLRRLRQALMARGRIERAQSG